jgi:hypothetical protein
VCYLPKRSFASQAAPRRNSRDAEKRSDPPWTRCREGFLAQLRHALHSGAKPKGPRGRPPINSRTRKRRDRLGPAVRVRGQLRR